MPGSSSFSSFASHGCHSGIVKGVKGVVLLDPPAPPPQSLRPLALSSEARVLLTLLQLCEVSFILSGTFPLIKFSHGGLLSSV